MFAKIKLFVSGLNKSQLELKDFIIIAKVYTIKLFFKVTYDILDWQKEINFLLSF